MGEVVASLVECCAVDLKAALEYLGQDDNIATETTQEGKQRPPQNDAIIVAWSDSDYILAAAKHHRLWLSPSAPSSAPVLLTAPLHDPFTALLWIAFLRPGAAQPTAPGDGAGGSDLLLLAGSSRGRLRIYAADGTLLQTRLVHDTPVVSLQARAAGAGACCDDVSEDVCVGFSDAVAQVDAFELEGILRRHQLSFRPGSRAQSLQESCAQQAPLDFSKWDLRRASPGAAAAAAMLAGRVQPSLHEELTRGGAAAGKCVAIITAGEGPALGSFAGPESEESLVAAASKLASAAAAATATAAVAVGSAVFSLISPWAGKVGRAALGQAGAGVANGLQQAAAGPEVPIGIGATPRYSFEDAPRRGRALCQAPRGGLALATDSLGRALLVDLQAPCGMALVRIWKGYRGADALWLSGTPPGSAAAGAAAAKGAAGSGPAAGGAAGCVIDGASAGAGAFGEGGEVPAPLLVALFVGARGGLLEVWRPRCGGKVATLRCGTGCRVFGSAPLFGAGGAMSARRESKLYVLDATGRVRRLEWA